MGRKKVISDITGWYVADFETSTEPNMKAVLKATNGEKETFVWCYGIASVHKESKMIKRGTDIEEFMQYILNELPNESVVFFHNLKFDGSFIMSHIHSNLRQYYGGAFQQPFMAKKKGKVRTYYPIDTLIDNMGHWFSITFNFPEGKCVNNVYEGVRTVRIWNSLFKIPLTVEQIGKAYGGDLLKGDIDYDLLRLPGYEPTAEEWDYLDRDCLIVANALHKHFELGHTRMTLASDCMQDYKKTLKAITGRGVEMSFDSLFPPLLTGTYSGFKDSYRGGYVYLMPKYVGLDIRKVVGYDINSSFPSVMRYKLLPFGYNYKFVKGELKEEHENELYIAKIKMVNCCIVNKHIPIIEIGGEYVNEVVLYETVITSIELNNVKKHYDYDSLEIEWYMAFESATGAFDDYIDKWNEIKATSKGADRQIAKLFLNSLYGKFGSNPFHKNVDLYFEDGVLKCNKFTVSEDEESMYLFVACFITAYARDNLYNAIQANYDRFIYCDTDSMYLIGHEDAVGIEVHPTKLGSWDKETIGTDARFLKPKCYSYIKNEERVYKAAGIPDKAKETINFDTDFHLGKEVHGKLSGKLVKGGTVLVPTKYVL